MWLLKKDNNTNGDVEDGETNGALCPCCRREFVLEGVLNGDADDERNGESDVTAAAVGGRNDASIQGGGSEDEASSPGLHLPNRGWTRNVIPEPTQTP